MILSSLIILAALTADPILVEAESFTVEKAWAAQEGARAACAPGGLSGGSALVANIPDAIARLTVQLPQAPHALWVRIYDWGRYSNHYACALTVNGEKRMVGVTEPLAEAFVWEKWGEVKGGEVSLTLSEPDGWATVVDCLLFTEDLDFAPDKGPAVSLVSVKTPEGYPVTGGPCEIVLRADAMVPRPTEAQVALRKDGLVLWQESITPPGGSGEWTTGATLDLPAISLPANPYLRSGEYDLALAVPGTSWSAGESVKSFDVEDRPMPKPCEARIGTNRGAPAVFVNGKPELPMMYLIAGGDVDKGYSQMADIGVRYFTMPAGMGVGPDGFDTAEVDKPFMRILAKQPEALMFPRVWVTPPQWWLDAHPEERVVFDDGTKGPQSMFSETWLADACEWVERYARFIRQSPYGDHVIGIHICSGVTDEWQSWGLWDNLRGDFSAPALKAWRVYLTDKYKNDESLSVAWGKPESLVTVAMPTRARRDTPSVEPRPVPEYQDVVDFYDFYWRGTVKAIETLSAVAKRGGGRDFLVGVFYGYIGQYGAKMQESQHLGIEKVADCPDIDFITSPAMYSSRGPGGTSSFMSVTESIKLRNKIWWDEADNRTHLTLNQSFGVVAPAQDLYESHNVLEREFIHTYTSQTAIWWFDMGGGWYDDPALLARMKEMRELADTQPGAWAPQTEVALFIDPKSAYRMIPETGALNHIPELVSAMPMLGAPYDTYLLADLPRLRDYKLYVFPMAFDLTREERGAIVKLKAQGKHLVFCGEAGAGMLVDGRLDVSPAHSVELLGFALEGDGVWPGATDGTVYWNPGICPPLVKLRDAARAAGVHLYSESDDAFYAGNGLVGIHAATEGVKTLRFSAPMRLREVFSDTPFEAEGDSVALPLRAKETRSFLVEPVAK